MNNTMRELATAWKQSVGTHAFSSERRSCDKNGALQCRTHNDGEKNLVISGDGNTFKLLMKFIENVPT